MSSILAVCGKCGGRLVFNVDFENIFGKLDISRRENVLSLDMQGLYMDKVDIITKELYCVDCESEINKDDIMLITSPRDRGKLEDYSIIRAKNKNSRDKYMIVNKKRIEIVKADHEHAGYSIEELPIEIKLPTGS